MATYLSKPVFDFRPHHREPGSMTVDQLRNQHNIGYAGLDLEALGEQPFASFRFGFAFSNLAQAAALLMFFDDRGGRRESFWCPSWEADLVAVDDMASGDTTIDVANVGYVDAYLGRVATGRYLALWDDPTVMTYRKVTNAVAVDGDTERLTLDATIGSDFDAESVNVSFLYVTRFGSDTYDEQFDTAGRGSAELSFVEMIKEYPA